jgi:hypothetical protein
MTGRGAAGIALVDSSDRVIQVAREINAEAGHQVAIGFPRGSLRRRHHQGRRAAHLCAGGGDHQGLASGANR